jgi:hypothetical protein
MIRDRYSLYALEASFLNRTNEVDELVVALCTKTLVVALTIAPVTIPVARSCQGLHQNGAVVGGLAGHLVHQRWPSRFQHPERLTTGPVLFDARSCLRCCAATIRTIL